MNVKFGLVVPAGPEKGAIQAWQTDLDTIVPKLFPRFDSLWMTDHFFWGDNPTYEAWTVISYLATRYPDHQVGSVVLGQGYRNPALTAKMVSTLQSLSDGRIFFGIGAGWKEDEYHAYGYPFPEPKVRVEQLEDTLEIVTRLWQDAEPVTYNGKHYHIADAYCLPKPDPVPPILVGGGGRKTMMLAARFANMWNIPDCNVEAYTQRLDILKEHCQTIGRDIAEIELSWFGRLSIGRTYEEALNRSDGKWHNGNALVGTISEVRDLMQDFINVGVSRFIVEVLDVADAYVQSSILEELIPQFQSE